MQAEDEMASTVEELYEQYVKPLRPEERLLLVEMIAHDIAAGAGPGQKKRSLLELEGVGAEIWKGIDAQEYVNELRSEWGQRP
jgi:hypothetical protein